jgi:hypothetical protein
MKSIPWLAAVMLVAAWPAAAQKKTQPAAKAPAAAVAQSPWQLEHVEAPREIGLGTMTVNVWAQFARRDGMKPVDACVLVLRDKRGQEQRVEMKAVDGAFGGASEEVVASVDTYAWVEDAAHPWEIQARSGDEAPSLVARGAIRVKPRIATPDLVLFDARGMVHPWVGSGAGGFTPGPPVEAGLPGGPPVVVDFDRDGLPDLAVPTRSGDIALLKNQGNGVLETIRTIQSTQDLAACALADVDGDERVDLVTAGIGGLVEIHSDLAPNPTASMSLRGAPDCLEIANVDGKGNPEICVGLLGVTAGEVHVFQQSAEGWQVSTILTPGTGGRGRVRALRRVPAESGRGDDLLVLSASGGTGALESWGRAADTQTEPGLLTGVRLAGEPIGLVSGRFQGKAAPPVRIVLVRAGEGAELIAIGADGAPRPVGAFDAAPQSMVALDLDADGDDDLATAADDLRLWINLGGRGFREAGESPYLLETPAVALTSGSLDERVP